MTAVAVLLAMAAMLPGTQARYPSQNCNRVIPMLALDDRLLGGMMRTTDGDCIVWASLSYHWWPSRLCNTVTHEVRHLYGDQHPIPRDRTCH